ncbi:hypothetical protein CAUP111243_06920 [Campylobacter upsaliensis]|uniref:Uncharacterized protein n=1 Tax=Campylobacter upsaliensis TaxID=28080 RepID=A0A448KLL7_CAMUP|nr:hypothetical protein [Campylobacter upsaliensis]EAH9285332.1 hypothetical protein [Campylobacter upsaliensis]EAL3831898.1 hypothetical protein [Campylobacter upsaliensis]EAL3915851.1 hypothetical protein [Campylobacter upsaliensis]EAL3984193.1 hypothetical protein [Campylobacter upsaliensis]MCA5589698.1 hypothetical protein [Campylobacter upsaliensis]
MNTINTLNANLPNSQNIASRKEILELKQEEQDKFKVDDISNTNSGFKVVFENKKGELMAVRINEENYQNLQNHFSSYTNYIAREDGSIRLNGEANAFVAEWFEKVSNTLFDANSLLQNETNFTSLSFHKRTTLESLQNLALNKGDSLASGANLEEKLNFALEKDINQDGKVSELDVKKENLSEILRGLKEASGGGANANTMQDSEKIEVKDKKEEELKDERTPLEKALEEGFASLSAEEKAKLESSHPQKFKEFQLEQSFTQDLKAQIARGESPLVDKLV